MRASRAAASSSERSTGAVSTTGSVFGIATIAQKPPAAAARVPVSRSSLCSWPGVRRWTCGSTKAGNRWRPVAVDDLGVGRRVAARRPRRSRRSRPSRTRTSCGASMRSRGSRTCAPRTSSVASRAGARVRAAVVMRAAAPAARRAVVRGCPRAARRGRPSGRRRPRLDLHVMTACGESTTSPDSSTPRFTGPGCMSTWRGCSRRPLIW